MNKKKLLDFRLFDQKKRDTGNLVQPRNDFIEFKKEEIQQSIAACFRERTSANRDKVAVTVQNKSVTYGFLDNYANRVAHRIVQEDEGADRHQSAALLFDHDIEMIIGLMAAVISGKTYVPIDPGNPHERLEYMLENSEAAIIVTHTRCHPLAETLRNRAKKNIRLIDIDEIEPNETTAPPGVFIDPDQVAYVLYTSGSTGKPKGVMQSHRNVLHFARVYTNALHIHQEDRLTLFSTYGFDAAKMDIFGALLNGATLYPYDIKQEENLHRLPAWLQKEKITIYHSIPTVYRYFTGLLTGKTSKENSQTSLYPQLRFIVLGGEPVYKNDVETYKKYFPDDCIFINGLGPTESTVTLQYFIDKQTRLIQEEVPVGYPAAETRVFLLDEENRETLVNEVGEIVYKSDYLALGYLKMPEKTNMVFKTDPLTGQGRVYRSGDLGRRLEDGTIQFVGRKDLQVKVRGYRIELGEIESKLDRIKGIKKSIVVCRQNRENENILIAYYQTGNGEIKDEYELERQLREYLPAYMIPAVFSRLESFPYTVTGKIDRKALLEQASTREFELDRKAKVKYTGIKAVEKKDYYTLAPAQKRLYIIEQMDPGKTVYNINTAATLEGEINKHRLEQTCRELIRRHESLRTSFHMIGDKPVQKVHDEVEFAMEYYQVEAKFEEAQPPRFEGTRGLAPLSIDPATRNPQPVTALISSFIRPFDLSKAPLVRVGLIKLPHTPTTLHHHPRPGTHNSQEGNQQQYILVIDMHHMISDFTSLGVFINEITTGYRCETRTELRIQYKDYREKQNRDIQKNTGKLKRQEAFWQKQLEGEIPVLDLPLDYPRPIVQDFTGSTTHFEIGIPGTNEIKALALRQGVTLFMMTLAICYTWLSKISGQEDINVGTVTAGRDHEEIQPIIGMFVNTLVLRNYPDGAKTFSEFLQEVKETTLAAYANQEYQFEDLVEKMVPTRDTSRNPLFDVMYTLDNRTITGEETAGLKVTPYPYERGISKFDLTLRGVDTGSQLAFSVEYSKKLFKDETINRLIHYFKRIIKSVLQEGGAGQRLSDIDILPREEKQQVLYDFNNTARENPRNKTLPQLFQQQVEKTPHRTALVFGHQKLTYRALEEQVNRAAGVIKDRGVKPGTIVGIVVERSIEMVVGIFAVLKAGAAYLPIDPRYPAERVKYMLENSRTGILLTTPGTSLEPREQTTGIVCIHGQLPAPQNTGKGTRTTSNREDTPGDLVYVIYTSGTTGKPKGTPIATKGFVNLVWWYLEEFQLNQEDRYLLIAPISFDLAQKNLYAPLNSGGCLCLARPGLPEYGYLSSYIAKEQQTVINCAPSIFYPLIEIDAAGAYKRLKSLRYVFLGGEPIQPAKLQPWMNADENHCQVVNTYGPTECTDVVSYYRIDRQTAARQHNIPIGKPIYNVLLYILDRKRKPLPVGIPGELAIGGIGIGRGYLNRPELTAERFCLQRPGGRLFKGTRGLAPLSLKVPNKDYMQSCNHASMQLASPYSPHSPHLPYSTYSPIYLTGDLARWLPEGELEYRGRIDQQVKIRGNRIELAEIETRFLTYPGIKEAVVITKDDENGEKYLCAYIVTDDVLPGPALREHLAKGMPEYMIPSYILRIEKIPLTPSGKVDRKALPGPELETGKNYAPPINQAQERLLGIWTEVLGTRKTKRIGIHDNFFELGGHSLKAAIMSAKIQEEFKVKFSLTEIFLEPTIEKMAKVIKEAAAEEYAAVEPAEEKEYYELSSAQKRLYILQQMEPGLTVYHISGAFEMEGRLEIPRLEETFQQLIKGHESFRTSFQLVKGAPVQRIHPHVEFKIEHDDAGCMEQSAKQGTHTPERDKECCASFVRPFDLTRAPLLRVGLIKIHEQKYIMKVDMHHITADGMSMGVFIRDLMMLYQGGALPGPRIRYRDYAEWQNKEKESAAIKQQEKFWLEQLAGETPVLNLPLDYPRPKVQDFEGETLRFEIPAQETTALKSLAFEQEVTLYMVLVSITNILLSKLSGQEEIVIGTPTAARRHAHLQSIIGMFVNTVVLRNNPRGNKPYGTFLKEVKQETTSAYENQEYPFEDLVEKVSITRDPGRNPLFDVMLAIQDDDIGQIAIPGMKITPYETGNKIAKFDLTIQMIEQGAQLLLIFEYCTKLFRKETIERYIKYFNRIVTGVIAEPGQEIARIEILGPEEKQRLLYEFNDTQTRYSAEQTLHELFAQQAKQTPDHVALLGHSEGTRGLAPLPDSIHLLDPIHITYDQLNQKSDQLAYMLIQKGVKPDTIVAIMMERSIEMIIGIWAILKAGGAYMPIDLEYPQERIDYMLKDSGAEILLKHNDLTSEAFNNCPKGTSSHLHLPPASATSLAYIIYTSGTTGKPKGNLTTHANVIRVVKNTNYIEMTENDRILQLSNYAFDGSVFDIYGALLNGSVLELIKRDEVLAVEQLAVLIIKRQITVFFVTTALFNTLIDMKLDCLAGVRKVLFGGERVSLAHAGKALAYLGKGRVIHVYGPTEATVYATYYFIDKIAAEAVTIPIGKPLTATSAYILDKYHRLVPIGVIAELYIGGEGLARGYLNQPELTAEKFINCRETNFYKSYRSHMSYIYRTGDLARWHMDGNIEFIGRIDNQVKIRGFRIEPGEIETRLLSHHKIKEAVVLNRESENGERYLCAYVVLKNVIPVSAIREYLSKGLPEYMIPMYFVELEQIPLTVNGKVDRKALPVPGMQKGENYAAPADEIEKQLVKIWAQVLGRDAEHAAQLDESIGIHDNFFEIGGHSLKATILVSRIHQAFDVKVSLAEIFVTPTIEELAKTIKAAVVQRYAAIEPEEEKEYYELSPAQKRIYVLQQMEPMGTSYNLPAVFEMQGNPGIPKLEEAIRKLIARHESFSTSFHLVKGTPVQRIHRHAEFEVEYDQSLVNGHWSLVNCQGRGEVSSPNKVEKIIQNFFRPFDLSQPPLLRVGLVEPPPTPDALCSHPSREGKGDKYLLMVDMHHIIADGTSMAVFIKDFMALYREDRLPGLRIHYKDYTGWQNKEKETETIKNQGKYWLNQFPGEIPALNLPLDNPRPMIQSFEGKTLEFRLDREDTAALKSLALEQEVTLYMLLLSIVNILLSKLSGQEEIIIGTPIAARRHADLQNIIGMFVNTLVLRNKPAPTKTFQQFLQEIKKNTLAAYENQEYPFEDLVEKVSVPRDASRNPLFDVMFILQNMETTEIQIPGMKLKPYKHENNISKFDLTLTGLEAGEKLLFKLEYCTKLFKQETITRFMAYFKRIVSIIQENSKIKISSIAIIPVQEKQQVLYHFNETSTGNAAEKPLHELFRQQVERTPDDIALVGSSQIKHMSHMSYMTHMTYISYRQLNRKSNQLAYLLKEKGVIPDTIVGLMVGRSVEMIIGILAILKAGGAYLPIDPAFPVDRITYMLKDSNVGVLVTTPKLQVKVKAEVEENLGQPQGLSLQFINIETNLTSTPGHSLLTLTSTLTCQVSPANLAYVIYTSGTTGRPKGVMIQHQAVHNFIIGMAQRIDFTPGKTILALTTISFDIFVLEALLPLMLGLRIVIADERQQMDINLLEELIVKTGVNMLQATPTRMQMFTTNRGRASCLHNLKEIMVGGELFPVKLLGDLQQLTTAVIYNMYGPTETTVWSTMKKLTPGEEINIGQPIANTQIYILDKHNQPQPLGVIGDLYIGGRGLARGYINRPELTAEKFCPRRPGGRFLKKLPPWTPRKNFSLRGTGKNNMQSCNYAAMQSFSHSVMLKQNHPPHSPIPPFPHHAIYRTGDLARWLPDGNIEFFGRIDTQVKIRGFRIELEEIEKHLLAYPGIKEAVVIDRSDANDNKFLCAYLVLTDKTGIDITKLREFLTRSLPGYMVPSYFVPVERIPLTANGKVDRKSLPAIESTRLPLHRKQGYAAPGTDIEKLIADIWKEVLELEKISIDDNFFEIGGNSLNMLQINDRLNSLFENKLAVIVMFRYTTIRTLAQFLQSIQTGQMQDMGEKIDRKKRAAAQNQGKNDREQRYQKRKKIETKINRK
jgi:tyrocidine synthetase-3